MVGAHRPAEADELANILDAMGNPSAVRKKLIQELACGDFLQWLTDRRNFRKFPHRMEDVGYVRVQNPDENRGRYLVDGAQQTVYARRELTLRERYQAADELVQKGTEELANRAAEYGAPF